MVTFALPSPSTMATTVSQPVAQPEASSEPPSDNAPSISSQYEILKNIGLFNKLETDWQSISSALIACIEHLARVLGEKQASTRTSTDRDNVQAQHQLLSEDILLSDEATLEGNDRILAKIRKRTQRRNQAKQSKKCKYMDDDNHKKLSQIKTFLTSRLRSVSA